MRSVDLPRSAACADREPPGPEGRSGGAPAWASLAVPRRATVCQVLHGLQVGGAEVLAARLARRLRPGLSIPVHLPR